MLITMFDKEIVFAMISFIQANPPLFILSILLLSLVIILWGLQYWIIQQGKQFFDHCLRYCGTLKQVVRKSSLYRRMQYKYPRFFVFLSRRFQPQHFYGLPLTLLLLAMGYILALFTGLVEDIVTSDSIVTIDHLVSYQMNMLREPNVVNFFIFITSFGSAAISCLIVILVCVICGIIRQPYILIGLLVSTIGSSIFTFLSKLLFHRTRPEDALLLEQSFSFPSGHATIAIALYGFLAYLTIRFSPNFIKQVRIFFTMLLFAVLLGLSRMVLNEHYLSDVLGGFLVGTLWLIVSISLTEWLSASGKITWQLPQSFMQNYTVGLSIILVLIATLIYAAVYQFPLLF
ncbi:MAG: phosphatase PAP2 family protein [Acinetobacter sp.]|uniref:phosphatase PAP2 family protein n=1 Tax=Acinetobacter sp. TaxID=472 RepID=UPI00260C4CFF|nr:phosphatase PAP2 family protein [Acinetobacter sp.]MDD2946662.1 phosphatase PAP2 family protein [Acinetobacter sp.]